MVAGHDAAARCIGGIVKFRFKAALVAVVLSTGLVACTSQDAPSDLNPPVPAEASPTDSAADAPTAAASAPRASSADDAPAALGDTVADSFGNALFYTTVDGDTLTNVAASFGLSSAKLAGFNGVVADTPLGSGTKLRLIPGPGPITGATGEATEDASGIPTSYVIAAGDTLDGISYRFGISGKQLAEANKVPYVYEQGNTYFIRSGHTIQLQKKPVDSRSGAGDTINNSFGQPIFYTTVDGDSFDSLGYQFRSTTEQLLMYNPSLSAGMPIPAGTKMRLIPGDLAIEGARGTFTADADGIPLTYTTAVGDTERQVAFRFSVVDLSSANRPLTGTAGSWYEVVDRPNGVLAPGQTVSLALNKPINR
ncbi:LysM repeat protein [Paenarthrobacter nicotinovorans]|uniref:LysM peptidoglycan-binding domain-containing protein n=1 Tax=Micrococcaceae TaxID=1268 RepID=UPI0008768F4A|nr:MULTISPECIES: LysM peptidoglycan-binding domain-containing protein [Micrococcaceae]MDR6437638.1 LysM repeat protein [Paenarthrobacter nicotinovorans]SCZ60950.1 LysM domain-containing protein [Arthrobacter sp. UNCCL28]